MAVWGTGIMLAPILGPTVGGWLADNWSWRWIFYINLPIGVAGFLMVSTFLFDDPFVKRPGRVDALGLAFMVLGFGFLQLVLDLGEKEDWFDSGLIVSPRHLRRHRPGGLHRPRADGGRADPRPQRLPGPQLRAGHHHHRPHRPGDELRHAAGGPLHAEDARVRRVDLGHGPRPGGAGHDDRAPHLGAAGGAHGPAASC